MASGVHIHVNIPAILILVCNGADRQLLLFFLRIDYFQTGDGHFLIRTIRKILILPVAIKSLIEPQIPADHLVQTIPKLVLIIIDRLLHVESHTGGSHRNSGNLNLRCHIQPLALGQSLLLLPQGGAIQGNGIFPDLIIAVFL